MDNRPTYRKAHNQVFSRPTRQAITQQLSLPTVPPPYTATIPPTFQPQQQVPLLPYHCLATIPAANRLIKIQGKGQLRSQHLWQAPTQQTYLRLHRAGFPVSFQQGLQVTHHREHCSATIRADNRPIYPKAHNQVFSRPPRQAISQPISLPTVPPPYKATIPPTFQPQQQVPPLPYHCLATTPAANRLTKI